MKQDLTSVNWWKLLFFFADPFILLNTEFYFLHCFLSYLKLYGRKFSKEDHLNFVHIFFELTCAPNLDPQYVIAFGHVLIQLLK